MTLSDFRDWPLHSESRALTFWICSTLVIIQGSQCITVPQCYKLFTIVESEPEIRMSQCLLCDVFWYLFHAHPRPPQRCMQLQHLLDIAHICLLNRDLRAHSTHFALCLFMSLFHLQ